MKYFTIAALLLLSFGVADAQVTNPCTNDGWGPCFGRQCPGGSYETCRSSELAGCYCPGCGADEEELEAAFQVAVMFATSEQASAGGGLLGPGAVLTLELQNDVDFPLQHSGNWGHGQQTIPIPAGALELTVQLGNPDPAAPDILPFTVVSLVGTIDSFRSVALAGARTGPNIFSLRGPSSGFVDLANGEFSVNLLAQFFNTAFGSHAAELDAVLNGSFDAVSGQVQLPLDPTNMFVVASAP